MNELIHIRYDHLTPWEGLNPRQYFDPAKGAELQSSIREHGIQETLLVAPAEGEEGRYHIIAGERRWRETKALMEVLRKEIEEAEEVATVERLKALVMDRIQVPCAVIPPEKVPAALELNLVENLCRADITPLEEAEGYERLRRTINQETGSTYSIEEIARKVAKEPSYVRRRMKLRLAPAFFLEAVNAGVVAATIAEKLGKIPDPKAREDAARLILKPVHPAPEQEVPLNYEQSAQLIREHFMVKINRGCGFDPAEEDLVPVVLDAEGMRSHGGSCRDCPMRSGNLTELDEEFNKGRAGKGKGKSAGIDPDLCTHPGCYKAKQEAAWLITRKAAEAANKKVIDGDAARKVFSGHNGRIAYDSSYCEMDERADAYHVGYGTRASEMTFGELIDGVKVETVLARNPHTGKVHQLVERERAIEAARKAKPELFKKGTEAGGNKAPSHAEDDEPDAEEMERERKQAVERKARGLILERAAERLKVTRPEDAEVNGLLLDILMGEWEFIGTSPAVESMLGLPDYASVEEVQQAVRAEMARDRKDKDAARRWAQVVVMAKAFDALSYQRTAQADGMVKRISEVLSVDIAQCFTQAEAAVTGAEQEGEAEPVVEKKEKKAAKKPKAKAKKSRS